MEPLGLMPALLGARAYDAQGARLGHVADVLFEVHTRRPAWLLLVLLRAEDRFVLVPARGIRHRPGGVHLPLDRAQVRCAPTASGPPNELGPAHAHVLALHYGVNGAHGPWAGIVEPSLGLADDRVRLAG